MDLTSALSAPRSGERQQADQQPLARDRGYTPNKGHQTTGPLGLVGRHCDHASAGPAILLSACWGGISYDEPWTATDTELARTAGHTSVATKRLGQATQNPVAAIFIGAFAANSSSRVTRHSSRVTRAISSTGFRP